jgi:hypothetical protein
MGEDGKLILQNYGLERYFDHAHRTSHEGMFKHKENPSKQHRRALHKNKKRRCQVNKSTTYNPFSGALVLPAFGLLIQGEVSNTHWYCDHHCLARSSADGTPDVMHCVIDNGNAKLLHSTIKESSLSRISGSREIIELVILAPEDISKKRMMTVEVIQLPQVLPITMVATMRGMITPSISSIMKMSFFGSENMRNDVDVMIILGNFTIDQNEHPKLLLLRFSDMLANDHFSIEARHTMARDLYHQLRPLCGSQGYKVKRRGGSSGLVSPQSDRDLLDCCHDVPGLLPRKLRGVLIMRGSFSYHMAYRNVSSSKFVHHAYSPPKEEGSFKMPAKLLLKYPVLAEFAYLNMMAVEILHSLNTLRVSQGLSLVCKGVYACEACKLHLAREKYKNFNLPGEGKMFAFLVCSTLLILTRWCAILWVCTMIASRMMMNHWKTKYYCQLI